MEPKRRTPLRVRRIARPIAPKPTIIIAQVEGSGTGLSTVSPGTSGVTGVPGVPEGTSSGISVTGDVVTGVSGLSSGDVPISFKGNTPGKPGPPGTPAKLGVRVPGASAGKPRSSLSGAK